MPEHRRLDDRSAAASAHHAWNSVRPPQTSRRRRGDKVGEDFCPTNGINPRTGHSLYRTVRDSEQVAERTEERCCFIDSAQISRQFSVFRHRFAGHGGRLPYLRRLTNCRRNSLTNSSRACVSSNVDLLFQASGSDSDFARAGGVENRFFSSGVLRPQCVGQTRGPHRTDSGVGFFFLRR